MHSPSETACYLPLFYVFPYTSLTCNLDNCNGKKDRENESLKFSDKFILMKNKQNMQNDLELNHIETANMVSKQI